MSEEEEEEEEEERARPITPRHPSSMSPPPSPPVLPPMPHILLRCVRTYGVRSESTSVVGGVPLYRRNRRCPLLCSSGCFRFLTSTSAFPVSDGFDADPLPVLSPEGEPGFSLAPQLNRS